MLLELFMDTVIDGDRQHIIPLVFEFTHRAQMGLWFICSPTCCKARISLSLLLLLASAIAAIEAVGGGGGGGAGGVDESKRLRLILTPWFIGLFYDPPENTENGKMRQCNCLMGETSLIRKRSLVCARRSAFRQMINILNFLAIREQRKLFTPFNPRSA